MCVNRSLFTYAFVCVLFKVSISYYPHARVASPSTNNPLCLLHLSLQGASRWKKNISSISSSLGHSPKKMSLDGGLLHTMLGVIGEFCLRLIDVFKLCLTIANFVSLHSMFCLISFLSMSFDRERCYDWIFPSILHVKPPPWAYIHMIVYTIVMSYNIHEIGNMCMHHWEGVVTSLFMVFV